MINGAPLYQPAQPLPLLHDEDGDEDDGEDVDLATQVVDSSKETVDAMFFLTEEEERSAR